MLHVLLLVLKILGILLLALLVLLAGCALLALFVPVRYRADGNFQGKPEAEASVSWLFRLFRLRVSYKETLTVTGKILWFSLFEESFSGAGKEEEPEWDGEDFSWPECGTDWPEDTGSSIEEEPEVIRITELSGPDGGEPLLGEREPADEGPLSKEAPHREDPETEDRTVWERIFLLLEEKIQSLPEKIRSRISRFREMYRKIKRKYRKAKRFLTSGANQKTFRLLRRQTFRLIRHIRPRSVKGTLRFGFEDPWYTGRVLAAVSPFYGLYARKLTLIPDFLGKALEGEIHIKGRIRMAAVLWIAGRMFLDGNFRRLLRRRKA